MTGREARPRVPRRLRIGRAGAPLLGIVDQGVSGLTNMLAIVAIARSLPAEEFGQFSIGYAGLIFLLASTRSYLGIPIALSARGDNAAQRRIASGALTATVTLSPLYATGLLLLLPLLGVVTGSEAGWGLSVALALASVAVLAQDVMRYAAIAQGRPSVALASDGSWLAGVVILLLLGDGLDPAMTLAVWVGSIWVSAAIAAIALRPKISTSLARKILTPRRGARESATLVAAMSTSTTLIVSALVAAAFSPVETGSLRGAATLLGPVNILIAALELVVLGRLGQLAPTSRMRALGATLLALWVALGAWAALLLLLPPWVGELLLGATWIGAREVVPIILVESALIAIGAVATQALIVQDAAYALPLGRVAASALTIGGTLAVISWQLPFATVLWFMVAASGLSAVIYTTAAMRGLVRGAAQSGHGAPST